MPSLGDIEVDMLFGQRNVKKEGTETLVLNEIEYRMTNFRCEGCHKYDMGEPHIHTKLNPNYETDRSPKPHQGQQMMAEFKSVDRMMDCPGANEQGYCDCSPDPYNNSPQVRESRMKEFGVEWNPSIIF